MSDTAPIPDGYWANPRGELIPASKVKEEDKLEDELVRRLAGHARAISEQLTALKSLAMSEAQSLKGLVAEQYGATRGGKKGNMTLRSYDGTVEMQVAVSETLSFGPQLAAAKELIDACIMCWSEGSNDNIRALIGHAFQVNKKGRIDTDRVLALRNLAIKDEDWLRAMDAISDAVRVSASKTYVRFYEVDPASGRRLPITLDLANA